MKRSLLALLVVLISITSLFAQEAEEDTVPSWCVSVWYPSSEVASGYESILENLDVIDTVNPFWYTALQDGTLHPSGVAEDEDKLTDWRTAGLTIMPAPKCTRRRPLSRIYI